MRESRDASPVKFATPTERCILDSATPAITRRRFIGATVTGGSALSAATPLPAGAAGAKVNCF
jgi:hypothetical protein